MPGSPEDAASTGDESSDIRTVRSNATHLFSQASYYTNPTLPASILERLESDEISSLGGPDYASPTSIMTNYESYSKLGAAPMYQTLPKAGASKPAQVTNQELKTIVEESPAVYQAPSFYKSQRRSDGKRHGENISNIAISASKSIAASSKSVEDGSIRTEKTTTSSSRSSTAEDPAKPTDVKPSSSTTNTFSMMFKRITSSSKSPARNRNASPVPDITENKKGSPMAGAVQSVRHAAKSARKSPPSSVAAANSPTTNGRDSPQMNIAIPKSIQVPPGNSSRPTTPTPTEPIRLSESQASTPKAGVHIPPANKGQDYINPTLKSVSSKLFVQETARDPPPPQLNLAAVDGALSPSKKFRLWTDEDSAIGATWYEFQQGPSFFASASNTASPPAAIQPDPLPPDTPSTLTTEAPAPTAPKPERTRAPPDTPSTLTAPEVIEPAGPKLSMSRLQLKQMHRGTSAGTVTLTDEDTLNSRGGYPSMVSSEYEDEGGTYPGDVDDCTTLGGGPSLDFSVSACIDDDSPKSKPRKLLSPIVYSNVGQALSRGDHRMPPAQNALAPAGALDRPQRVRRNSSMSTSKHSSTLEIIDEHGVPVVVPPEGDTSMVVVSIAEATHRSGRSSGSSEKAPRERVVVIRKLDALQIGIIVLIGVALAAVICATFCLVGSCQVGGRRRLRGAVPSWTAGPRVDPTASHFSPGPGN